MMMNRVKLEIGSEQPQQNYDDDDVKPEIEYFYNFLDISFLVRIIL